MKINVEKLKEAIGPRPVYRAGTSDTSQSPQEGEEGPPARPRVSSHRGYGFDDLGALMAAGCLTRLVVRDNGDDGSVFTLKAVLSVRGQQLHVYMHGVCRSSEELPEVLDRLIRKGDWHEDKFPSGCRAR